MMTLRNGKFYKDGQPYPVEFGNKEQIALQKRMDEFVKEGIEPDEREIKIVKYEFVCLCRAILSIEHEDDEFNYDPLDAIGKKVKCSCGLEFYLDISEEFKYPIVKLKVAKLNKK